MDMNLAALIVIGAFWLARGARLNLSLVVVAYYVVYMLTETTDLAGHFEASQTDAMGIYAVQSSIDTAFIMLCLILSNIYQKFIKLYLWYAVIIGTSLLLNGLMLYAEMLNLSAVYILHAARQEFSIPLDVAFAVLGSAHGKKLGISNSGLRGAYRSAYNHLNRISNHL